MNKSTLFNQLPDITFADYDTDSVSAQIISAYEKSSGRTLALSDPVRIFLLTISDIIAHQRVLIDIAAKNNLLAYAEGSYLDHIGALHAVTRKDGEDDESFRKRIYIAPEHYSTAGPAKAYEYYAMSAHPDIIDAKILTPPDTQPGHVHIYPLMKGGNLPSTEIIDAVFMACSGDDVRPDTDFVEVFAPGVVGYTLNVSFWIDSDDSPGANTIRKNVSEAVTSWVDWQKSKLGRDINPSELTRRIINAGAKRCVIHSPAFTVLKPNQVAIANSINWTYEGLEDS